jgi:exonuclease SbcD
VRLVHLADLHLGYRQYQRLTPGGINQREADIARTFDRAIDQVIALAPDIVLFAGDIFHSVRPSNPAIVKAFMGFDKLTRALPDALVFMVAGNHDTPRSAETGCILQLFDRLGIYVVDHEAQRFPFPDRDLSVLCVPDGAGDVPAFLPEQGYKHNVLLFHGGIEGAIPEVVAQMDRASIEVPLADLRSDLWSYVALGHYHVQRQLAANVFYSGSLDYTSVNTWGEKWEAEKTGVPGKGFMEWDLETGTSRFHVMPESRPLIDLQPVEARGKTIADINEAIRSTVEGLKGGIDDKIVRLLVRDVPRHLPRELDHRAIREYKRRALHFHLDLRKPDVIRTSVSGAPRRRLHEMVREHLNHRTIEADVDRDTLIALGLDYLDKAELANAPVAAASTGGGGE